MKASKLIEELSQMIKDHGDLPVCYDDSENSSVEIISIDLDHDYLNKDGNHIKEICFTFDTY